MKRFFLLIFTFIIASCSQRGEEALRDEARSEIQALICLLETIDTTEDLLHCQSVLKSRFSALVEVMLEIKRYRIRKNIAWKTFEEDLAASDQLRHEMRRVLRLDGAKILVEKCQAEALERLAASERHPKAVFH